MSLIQGNAKGSSAAFYTKTIAQSLRFEDGDNPYLSWTPSGAGTEETWTFSCWLKRGDIKSTNTPLFTAGTSTSNYDQIYIQGNQIRAFGFSGGSVRYQYTSTQLLRDPSSWYHLVVRFDQGNATAADRVQIYLNGTRITDWVTETTSGATGSYTGQINSGSNHQLGGWSVTGNEFDGYLAEVHFTDGTAYTADSFGELKSGIWIPKSPSVTYGTNGFKLTFEDSAAIGDDTSGNSNDWTVNNLVASDVVLDSPTNNFATLNPEQISINTPTFSEGNLKHSCGAAFTSAYSSISPTSGKWYAEVYKSTSTVNCYLGIQLGVDGIDWDSSSESRVGTILYYADGRKRIDGTMTTYGASYTTGDVIGIAVDFDSEEITFYKNGASQGALAFSASSGDPSAITFISFIYNQNVIANFGQDSTFAGSVTAGGNTDANGIGDFKYTVPSGFLALCTSNLPDPVIDPAQDATPEDHFNVIAYSGTGSQSVTGVGFQPDLVWVKGRDFAYNHQLHDVVRGATAGALFSNTTTAETAFEFDSFDSDGFTTDSGNVTGINNTGKIFVAWNWKANGTGVSNTDGSITSTVSANTDAGFSIVGYTGNGTAGATVGHGLSSAPEFLIVKNRDVGTTDWTCYHKGVASDAETDGIYLNSTSAAVDQVNFWNDTAPTASVSSLGISSYVNSNTVDYIMYCFHSVDGFSKAGSYVGNGSADGTFVNTGFRPKWVMVKRSSGTGAWRIWDAERIGYNTSNYYLDANASTAEVAATGDIDILSNGFKLRDTDLAHNTSGATYIYLAFAEQPFKYSNAR